MPSYKSAEANATDETGATDHVEFINIAKDDAISWPIPTHHMYPSTVSARMESTIILFVHKSIEVNKILMDMLNDRLGLPKGALMQKHALHDFSRSEARCIKSSKNIEMSEDKATLGAHTDFGSLPISGHAICNLGDAIAVFSAEILRSNLHRVVPPPKKQAAYDHWSLVFFTCPGNKWKLAPLSEESEMIAKAAAQAPLDKYVTNSTAEEWFARRIKYEKLANRKVRSNHCRDTTDLGPTSYHRQYYTVGPSMGIDSPLAEGLHWQWLGPGPPPTDGDPNNNMLGQRRSMKTAGPSAGH
ncbi:hypothetical protein EW146_g2677 [Bondarzewia mesenterica]|uniref:Isopenicillin N synthase-like Fe(2+) 2OG dioxygenase domain-containing protein n=1 Tax=Bondarzewia mesenterica TaxID=1095465 RepID=A0A4S4LZZ9_9AGAM|nr:hypothetical protein EW146_g2677 [Bondarzewia mesenterica]